MRAGEYDISLELDGYWPWERRIRIEAGKSTFIEDIELVKQDQASLQVSGKFKNWTLSTSKNRAALFQDNGATLFNLEDSSTSSFILAQGRKFDNQVTQWSFDDQKILHGGYLFQISKWDRAENLSLLIGPEAKLSTFPDDRSGGFYFSASDDLYWYDLGSNRKSLMQKGGSPKNISEKDDRLFMIGQEAGRSFVEIFKNEGQEKISRINLPLSDYNFIQGGREIELYDQRNSILYIINPSSAAPIKEALANAKHFSWRDENTLIYANDFEIWSYETENGSKNLITRVGKKINSLSAPRNSEIIYFASENKLYSIDGLSHNTRHISEILALEKIFEIKSDNKGKLLYFLGKNGNDEGLFALGIK